MLRLSFRQRYAIAGVLGVCLAFSFLLFLAAGTGGISSKGSIATPEGPVVQGAFVGQPPAPSPVYDLNAVAGTTGNGLYGLGILGMLGGVSLGVAVFSSILTSKRFDKNGKN